MPRRVVRSLSRSSLGFVGTRLGLLGASLLGSALYVACGGGGSFTPTPPASAGSGGKAGSGGTAGMGEAGSPDQGGAGGEAPMCPDEDGDGVTTCEQDCDDDDDEVYPGYPDGDVCGDGKDNDCDGDADPPASCCPDDDGDGVTQCEDDCDDDDDEMFPGNPDGEVCGDDKDNDCDGDADPTSLCCPDEDDDGVGTCEDDCDDDDDEMFPGNPLGEVCGDGKDNDCDGGTDPVSMCCPDDDGDGVTTCDDDCDDDDPSSFPGNPLGDICGDGRDNDCDMTADPPLTCDPMSTGAIGTYVSMLSGQDPPTGTGTQTAPVRTIAQGMANAVTLANGQPVFVAEGDYQEIVVMQNGVSLLGGHQCDTTTCSWTRDPSTYVSRIVNKDTVGVAIDHNVFAPTRLDGFTVQGLTGDPGSGLASVAVTIAGGTPIVENCRIIGGNVTGGSSRSSRGLHAIGPMNDPAGAVVRGCTLQAGDSTASTSAISMAFQSARTNPAVLDVSGNVIRGGNGQWTRAVDTWGAGPGTLFFDNDIFAGSVLVSNGSSFAMFVSGTITVDSNRINHDALQVGACPATNFWCGGIESEGSTSIITNNVVHGMLGPMSAAIYFGDGEIPFGEIQINGNTLNGVGLFNPATTSVSAALACRTTSGTNAVVGRIRNNILDGGQARLRFGMYEQENTNDLNDTCHPQNYEHNNVFFRPRAGAVDNAHRQWLGGASSQVLLPTVTELNMQSYARSNFTADCLLDGTFHLGSGSPCIDQGVATEAPARDLDDEARPMGMAIDVGADEAE